MWTLPSRMAIQAACRCVRCCPPLPCSLTVSVTNACNAQCRTCQISKLSADADALRLEEYDRIFASISKRLFWATLTGGEPSLRNDLPDIVASLVKHSHPAVITLPTNGMLPDKILSHVQSMLPILNKTRLLVNVSLDGDPALHNDIRGSDRSYDNAQKTLANLKLLSQEDARLSVGIHTVISRFNAEHFADFFDTMVAMRPHSYVAELAAHRTELNNAGLDIEPKQSHANQALCMLQQDCLQQKRTPLLGIVHAGRQAYYRYLMSYFKQPREIWPCYAGSMTAHLAADGVVWCCGVRGLEMGNVRNQDYDFVRVWKSEQAQAVRHQIRKEHCHCTLANAAYINMLMSPTNWLALGARMFGFAFFENNHQR